MNPVIPFASAALRLSLHRLSRVFIRYALLVVVGTLAWTQIWTPAWALDKVIVGANWLAEAEHGGFYQALADGTYARFGLDVTIVPGGPQINNRLLLAARKIDFYMGENLFGPLGALENGAPVIVIAAMFQKDPIVLLSHPGVGLDRFEDLSKARTYVALPTLTSVYRWLVARWGFSDKNVAPYNFNAAPFIADRTSIQQGYVTSEPYSIEQKGGFRPNTFLLADYGYESYATTIETRPDLIAEKPDVAHRFVRATAIGWRNYLHGDNKAANALIRQKNPDIDDAQIAFSIAQMKHYGLVDSGDAQTQGIGVMTHERLQRFYDTMVAAKAAKPNLDFSKAYDLRFVGKPAEDPATQQEVKP